MRLPKESNRMGVFFGQNSGSRKVSTIHVDVTLITHQSTKNTKSEAKRMVSGLFAKEMPLKRLRVRLPWPPLENLDCLVYLV